MIMEILVPVVGVLILMAAGVTVLVMIYNKLKEIFTHDAKDGDDE